MTLQWVVIGRLPWCDEAAGQTYLGLALLLKFVMMTMVVVVVGQRILRLDQQESDQASL